MSNQICYWIACVCTGVLIGELRFRKKITTLDCTMVSIVAGIVLYSIIVGRVYG